MGYKPRKKSPKGAIHEYIKPLREKGKRRKRIHRGIGRPTIAKKQVVTEREISEVTLQRLHTLGSQKFGSSPFSEHFGRWLTNVKYTLSEFESHPNMNVDDQFVKELSQTLANISLQLEDKRLKEVSHDQETRNLSNLRSRLEQINTEYVTMIRTIESRKNREIKRLYANIDRLKRDQDKVIRMKTGFFRGISRKDREQKEIEIDQELNDKQRELELIMLNSKSAQKKLRDEYERKKEPFVEQLKYFRKTIEYMEKDGSLEERWFACEALIDAVNSFLQRKAIKPIKS